MYHDVYQVSKTESGINIDSAQSYKISSEQFEKQIKLFREYIDTHHIEGSKFRLSFDDGGLSFLTVVAPILEKYGFKGLFFIATGFLNTEGFLNDKQVVELSNRGHFIGSHSHSHRQMMSSLSREELLSDWKTSVDYLSGLLNYPITIASLPNGFSSDTIMSVLEEVGVKEVYTSTPTDTIKQYGGLLVYGRWGIKDGMTENTSLKIAFNPIFKTKIKIKKSILNMAKFLMGSQYIKIRESIYKH